MTQEHDKMNQHIEKDSISRRDEFEAFNEWADKVIKERGGADFHMAFMAGIAAERKRSEGLVEALGDLLSAYERLKIHLKKQKRSLIYMHNCDEPMVTKDNLRAEALVIASNIGLELEGMNFWNIAPAIKKSRKALTEYNKLTGGGE